MATPAHAAESWPFWGLRVVQTPALSMSHCIRHPESVYPMALTHHWSSTVPFGDTIWPNFSDALGLLWQGPFGVSVGTHPTAIWCIFFKLKNVALGPYQTVFRESYWFSAQQLIPMVLRWSRPEIEPVLEAKHAPSLQLSLWSVVLLLKIDIMDEEIALFG